MIKPKKPKHVVTVLIRDRKRRISRQITKYDEPISKVERSIRDALDIPKAAR